MGLSLRVTSGATVALHEAHAGSARRRHLRPFAEEDLMEMRHLAGFILDFADEVDLMARGRRAALELKRMAERSV